MTAASERSHLYSARRDLLTGSIVIATTLLFIWTGGRALAQAFGGFVGIGPGVEQVLLTAVLLNIALLLFGYRRYRDLQIEIIQRKEAEERAHMLAATDPLTGFLNRRSVMDEGGKLFVDQEAGGNAIAGFVIDLDNFKTVNDIYGHVAGDAVLTTIAERMRSALPEGAIAARLGGDEFACFFGFAPSAGAGVDAIADRLNLLLALPVSFEGSQLIVSGSIGMARSDQDGHDIATLMRRADIAMYAAKQHGRNQHLWFTKAMEQDLNYRNSIEANMRKAIPAGEFVPYYEQQVDLVSGRLLGFEMLARWDSPELGQVPPDVFIPVAEETGMIGDLSFAVMRKAFLDAKGWDASLTLSVNISPAQLHDPWLSHKVLKLLTETGFPPERLEIEITETALFDNLPLAQSIVASLKNQGIRIALDDFGTGYSSLAHLRALPFDRLKIDRSFVASMTDNSESAAIVQAIARLAESLGLPVTAEGVESSAIETQLRDLGLAKAQGWHFGKPMSVEEARELLSRHALLNDQVDETPAVDPVAPPWALETRRSNIAR